MTTYLLAWNPKRWHWDDLPDRVREIEQKGSTVRRWSCGNSTQIRQGDRLFLIRLGEEPKGILASGNADSDWHEDSHWERNKARTGEMSHYVDVRFDALLTRRLKKSLE